MTIESYTQRVVVGRAEDGGGTVAPQLQPPPTISVSVDMSTNRHRKIGLPVNNFYHQDGGLLSLQGGDLNKKKEGFASFLYNRMEQDETSRRPSSNPTHMERFLDDNGEFLEDYILRKVPRSKLERWLFSSPAKHHHHKSSSGSSTTNDEKASKKSVGFTFGEDAVDGPPALAVLDRQRSRSFTPSRRKLSSASAFEELGLSKPIVNTDDRGIKSFLKTNASFSDFSRSTSVASRNSSVSEIIGLKGERKPEKIKSILGLMAKLTRDFKQIGDHRQQQQRKSSLLIRQDWAKTLTTGLVEAFDCDSVSVFVSNKPSQFSGTEYAFSAESRTFTADRSANAGR